jgi:TPR repeat protein
MMVGRERALSALIGAAAGTLFLFPAHGSAQDSLSVPCADVYAFSQAEDLIRCAGQGLARAQYGLGRLFAAGSGLPQDDAEAARWYQLAAEQGHDRAQYDLGLMYANGEGVPEDVTEAARLYRLAADQGHTTAQFRLGVL